MTVFALMEKALATLGPNGEFWTKVAFIEKDSDGVPVRYSINAALSEPRLFDGQAARATICLAKKIDPTFRVNERGRRRRAIIRATAIVYDWERSLTSFQDVCVMFEKAYTDAKAWDAYRAEVSQRWVYVPKPPAPPKPPKPSKLPRPPKEPKFLKSQQVYDKPYVRAKRVIPRLWIKTGLAA